MEGSVNVAVVYYSSTGTVYRIATEIAEASQRCGARVRLLRAAELAPQAVVDSKPAWKEHLAATADVPVATPADVAWADALILGTPTRFGAIASQLKQFIDTLGPMWMRGELADKAYSAFVSGTTPHGGMETTLTSMYTMVYHFGGIVVPPGFADPVKFEDGNPYGTSHVIEGPDQPVGRQTLAAAQVQARRVVQIAAALKAARAPQENQLAA